jgi:hypothetical protein
MDSHFGPVGVATVEESLSEFSFHKKTLYNKFILNPSQYFYVKVHNLCTEMSV